MLEGRLLRNELSCERLGGETQSLLINDEKVRNTMQHFHKKRSSLTVEKASVKDNISEFVDSVG